MQQWVEILAGRVTAIGLPDTLLSYRYRKTRELRAAARAAGR
ncbi:MAG: hypothetical protein ABW328_05575 [Ilumatobacteraceae bacterium]